MMQRALQLWRLQGPAHLTRDYGSYESRQVTVDMVPDYTPRALWVKPGRR